MTSWTCKLRHYYGKRSKQPGLMAIETVHRGELSRDTELQVSARRLDIGRVESLDLTRPGSAWQVMYDENEDAN